VRYMMSGEDETDEPHNRRGRDDKSLCEAMRAISTRNTQIATLNIPA